MNKITFKDLSWELKVLVIYFWFVMIINIIAWLMLAVEVAKPIFEL